MLRKLLVVCLLASFSLQSKSLFQTKKIGSLSSSPIHNPTQKAIGTPRIPEKGMYGFIKVNNDGDDLYYMLYPPRNKVDNSPLIIWLSGGPGCASTMAMIYENGPIFIDQNRQAQKNPFSWNDKAWLMFIDQPLGTGFGHSSYRNIPDLEPKVADNFLTFMLKFYELHPDLKKLRLFVTGESYAGHYIPAIANRLYLYQDNLFKLEGIAIGNGWTSPNVQQSAYVDFAKQFNLVKDDPTLLDNLRPKFRACESLLKVNSVMAKTAAIDFCEYLFGQIANDKNGKPRWNYYNYKEPCVVDGCIDLTKELDWLSDPLVLKELGTDTQYVDCSDAVGFKMYPFDMATDAGLFLPPLLNKGLKVLAYNGDLDVICNYLSGEAWTNNVKWNGQDSFNKAQYTDAKLADGTAYGQIKTFENFSLIRFYQAGHLVPHDKPAESLYMINWFTGLA